MKNVRTIFYLLLLFILSLMLRVLHWLIIQQRKQKQIVFECVEKIFFLFEFVILETKNNSDFVLFIYGLWRISYMRILTISIILRPFLRSENFLSNNNQLLVLNWIKLGNSLAKYSLNFSWDFKNYESNYCNGSSLVCLHLLGPFWVH